MSGSPSLAIMSSAIQTIEEESSPPLSSARIGESERKLRRTDCRNTIAEVLFVFGVGLVANSRVGAESPEAFNPNVAVSNAHELSWRNFANLTIGSQMRIRIMSEVSCNVVVVDVELVAREKHQRTEIR